MIGAALMAYAYWQARRHGYAVSPRQNWSERWSATWQALPALILPVIILGVLALLRRPPVRNLLIMGTLAVAAGAVAVAFIPSFQELLNKILEGQSSGGGGARKTPRK